MTNDQSNLFDDTTTEPVDDSALATLDHYVTEQLRLQRVVETLEDELSQKKAELTKISGELIPNVLAQYGLSEIKLKSGKKICVKQELSVSVPVNTRQQFYAFLSERKDDAIIKLNVAFERMSLEKQSDLITFLSGYDYDYNIERSVHAQTLKKYFKELLGVGVESADLADGLATGRYLTKEQISSFASVFPYFKTSIE